MDNKFDPKAAEAKWYPLWKERGYFKPEANASTAKGKPYTITIPPPNVTGSLHMGHALCYSIQDILGRRQRMLGREVLILPGVDHAGIATQNVVEKEIAAEKLTRHDLGREKFLERVWNWKERYGARIITQLQGLGCAFDWDRERFTMDEAYVDAILEEFIRMFDAGMIYRGARVINWCTRCATALSDIEVEYVERASHLWHIRYDFSDGNGSVTVATTRPETMLGDTAVAVNPNDPRYAGMEGRMLDLPLTGRKIPLIFDEYASMEFGTGAVKVTPAHDLNDYEAGKRHGLPMMVVIGEAGRMTAEAGDKYAGLTREEAREAVVEDLEAQGYLVQIEDYKHSVGTCERCHTIIEPLLSEQWFAKMAGTPMIARTIEAIESNSIAFVPDRYKKITLDWLENIRDWCISRQLWWGHRIPIFYAHDGKFTAARTREEAAVKLGIADPATLRQDEDVLDTWFSSALWPFATLGWPEPTTDLARFYPTSVLVTSREIVFLWVARMIMTGLEFLGEKPFDEVYIYATVLDKQGRRMSKSLGNGIDPLEMIEKYGADALRFSLVRLASKGQDIKFSEDRIPESRNFCTKIWNASRFVILNATGEMGLDAPPAEPVYKPGRTFARDEYTLPERWIVSKLQRAAKAINAAMDTYDIDEACKEITEFFWNDYCDWFVELSKPALRGDDDEAKQRALTVLISVLDSSLRLLHPFTPFLTEEIRENLLPGSESIMFADYPTGDESLIDSEAETQMGLLIAAVRAVRNARAELGVPPSLPLEAMAVADTAAAWVLKDNMVALESLAKVRALGFVERAPKDSTTVALPVAPGLDLFLPLAGIIDFDKERIRLETELAATEKDLKHLNGKLGNPMFVAKAAPDVVEKDRALLASLTDKHAKLTARKAALGG